ncbi:MAG: ATP-binding cassette domain-containing protein [Chthoniobacterales bacterium]
MPPLLCKNLSCEIQNWRGTTTRVEDVTLQFEDAAFHAVCGDEGCGKNLLLELLGLLERPTSGEIYFEKQAAGPLNDEEREKIRNEKFGYLLEGWTLLPAFTVVENIAIPYLRHFEARPEDARSAAEEALEFCGILDFASALACDLTPSIQEVTAFARAIAHKPKILLAESSMHSNTMLALARAAVNTLGSTVIWSGTREELIGYSDRFIEMAGGRVICDEAVQRIP